MYDGSRTTNEKTVMSQMNREPVMAAEIGMNDGGTLEDFVATLNSSNRQILIGIGAGDPELASTLLGSLPGGTEDLFKSYGVIDDTLKLTETGWAVARQLAYKYGNAPNPADVAVAADLERELTESDQSGLSPELQTSSASSDQHQMRQVMTTIKGWLRLEHAADDDTMGKPLQQGRR